MKSLRANASFPAVKPLRIAQVGLGAHGRNWARRVLPDITEAEVVAYVDSDPYALDALRQEMNPRKDMVFESLREAIATTQPDAQELVDVAARAGLVLMVSQNYRYFPAPRAIARIVREETLGKLHEVSIDFRRYSPIGPSGRGRHHLEEQPLLQDMSIHHFDLLRLIVKGEPERIYCEAWNPRWTAFGGPSATVASIVFPGVVVGYRGSWISAGPITPWAGQWSLEFEHGEVFWTNRDADMANDRVVIRPRGARPHSASIRPMARTGPWGTITEFVDCVRTGREPETSGRDNLGTIAFVAAAVESAAVHEPVSIYRTGEALAI